MCSNSGRGQARTGINATVTTPSNDSIQNRINTVSQIAGDRRRELDAMSIDQLRSEYRRVFGRYITGSYGAVTRQRLINDIMSRLVIPR